MNHMIYCTINCTHMSKWLMEIACSLINTHLIYILLNTILYTVFYNNITLKGIE